MTDASTGATQCRKKMALCFVFHMTLLESARRC